MGGGLSVTLSGRNAATLAPERRCLGWCLESEGLHASRIMAVTDGDRWAWARRWPAVLAWALWALAILGLLVTAWLDHLLRQAGRPDLAQETAGVPAVLVVLSATTVGAVLASRRPATHAHRVAALAPLALVGQGHGGRAGRLPGGDAAATPLVELGLPDARQPAGAPCPRRRPARRALGGPG